jgi:hypothetical protein
MTVRVLCTNVPTRATLPYCPMRFGVRLTLFDVNNVARVECKRAIGGGNLGLLRI